MNEAIERLARQIADLQEQVNDRSPQLIFSSLEDGAILEHDRDGALVGQYGKQYDGTSGAAAFNGPRPPTPTKPVVTPGLSSLVVTWDGLYTDADMPPMNFARVEVHASTDPDFQPLYADSLVGTIETPRGGPTVISTGMDFSTHYVYLLVRSTSGVLGPASARAQGDPDASIETALTAADGKNTVTFSVNAPTPDDAGVIGDMWYRRNPVTGVTMGTWNCQGGTPGFYLWTPVVLDDQNLASLNVGKLVSGSLDIGVQIGVGPQDGDHSVIGGSGLTTIAKVGPPSTVMAVADDFGVIPNAYFNGAVQVRYYVTTLTASGESLPSSPTPYLTPGAGGARQTVALTWEAVPGATGYNVYRQSASTLNVRLIAANVPVGDLVDSGVNTQTTTSLPTTSGAGLVTVFDTSAGNVAVGGTITGVYRSTSRPDRYTIDSRGFRRTMSPTDVRPMSLFMGTDTSGVRRAALTSGRPNPASGLEAIMIARVGGGTSAVDLVSQMVTHNGVPFGDMLTYTPSIPGLAGGSGGSVTGGFMRIGHLVIATGELIIGGQGFIAGNNRWIFKLPYGCPTVAGNQMIGSASASGDGTSPVVGFVNPSAGDPRYMSVFVPSSDTSNRCTALGGAGANNTPGGVPWAQGGYVRWSISYITADDWSSLPT